MSCLSDHAHQDQDQLMDLREVSNLLRVEGHFKALWKRLEFPSSLELFPPSHPALNICSCGSGLENSAGVRSGRVDHTLKNLDISFFDKVKSSTPRHVRRPNSAILWTRTPVRTASSGWSMGIPPHR